MKYYHVIYNSSEKGATGSPGFGVRSVTEGAPPELTSAMSDAEMFAFTPLGPSLVPSAIQQNPDIVLSQPPQYFFGSVNLSDKSRYYVLGRKVAVGFDYSFYKNGNATRPGNYVVDAYAFDTVPTATDFEILLENPASGSHHFIPASPAPRSDNEEMRRISLGHEPTMPSDSAPFNAQAPAELTGEAYDMLFAFIQSRKEGKPLMIRCKKEDAPRLMAMLARLVAPEMIVDLSFCSNYASEGKKKGVNIYFINEYYNQEIFKKQWTFYDFSAGDKVDTPERHTYIGEFKELIAKGDFATLHNKVRWCMSGMFDRFKDIGADGLRQLYCYFHDYDNFALRTVAMNDKFRSALCECFAENPKAQDRLNKSMQESFDHVSSLNHLLGWMTFVLRSKGVNFENLVDANRPAITAMVLQSPENFLAFRSEFKNNYEGALHFIDNAAYSRHLVQFVADRRYSPLFEEIFAAFRTDSPERIKKLVVHICAYSDNPEAPAWAKNRGGQVLRNLYNSLLSAVKSRSMTPDEAASLCRLLGKSRLPQSVIGPFIPLGMVLSQTESCIEPRMAEIFDLAVELNMNAYLSRIAGKVLNSPAIAPARVVPCFLENGIMTPQRLMVAVKNLAQPQKYWIEVLRHQKLKPRQMLDLLCDLNGLYLDDDTAMNFLRSYFPEAHAKIEKSRRPSVFSRLMGMFGKKSEDNDNNKTEKNKRK